MLSFAIQCYLSECRLQQVGAETMNYYYYYYYYQQQQQQQQQ